MNDKVHKFQENMDITYDQHFRAVAMARLVLAREFERVLNKEKAHEVVGKAFDKNAPESAKQFCFAYDKEHPIQKFDDFVPMITGLFEYHQDQSTPEMAFTGTVLEVSNMHITVEMTECLWADVFRDLEAAELGYIMCCKGDFAMAQAFSPKLNLEMTETLMQGDNRCCQVFRWEE